MADETQKERIDREIIELLNELRVTLPGVQVMFAFLLILPFQSGFADLTGLELAVYFVALLATTTATILLITPASFHRLRFRARDKERMLRISNRLTIAGILCLAVAITAAVFLVTEVLFGDLVAIAVATAIALSVALFWFAVPLYGKVDDD